MRDEVIELKIFIKWIRRIVIAFFVFMIIVYTTSYMMPAPILGQGHYIKLYDNQNQLYYQSNQQSNDVTLKDVSNDFIKSIVAIEDHRFYQHRGFDPVGIMRAIKANLLESKKAEGCLLYTSQAVLAFTNS